MQAFPVHRGTCESVDNGRTPKTITADLVGSRPRVVPYQKGPAPNGLRSPRTFPSPPREDTRPSADLCPGQWFAMRHRSGMGPSEVWVAHAVVSIQRVPPKRERYRVPHACAQENPMAFASQWSQEDGRLSADASVRSRKFHRGNSAHPLIRRDARSPSARHPVSRYRPPGQPVGGPHYERWAGRLGWLSVAGLQTAVVRRENPHRGPGGNERSRPWP